MSWHKGSLNASLMIESDSQPKGRVTGALLSAICQALVGLFVFGYNTSLFNIPADKIRENATEYGEINDFDWEIVNAMFPFGAGIGALFTGTLADRFGRRKLLLINAIICIVGSIITGLSFYFVQLLFGRFIIGITSGIATGVGSVYLNEISPIHLRGIIGTTIQLILTFAILVSELLGAIWLLNDWLWRIGCIIPAILSLIQFIVGLAALPHSPHWLASNGNIYDAKSTLIKLRGDDNTVQIELQEYMSNNNNNNNNNNEMDTHGATLLGNDEFNTNFYDENNNNFNNNNDNFSFDPTLNLCTASRRYSVIGKILGISIFVHILQQLSGINVVFYYSQYLLQTAGVSNAFLGSVAIAFANFLSVFLATYLIEKKGRRILFLVSSAGMVLASGILTIMFIGLQSTPDGSTSNSIYSIGAIICLVLYVVTFELGLGPITWLYVAEITPIEYRGKITSIAQMVNYSCNTIIALSSTSLLDALGEYGFAPFGVVCLIGTIVNYKILPETKSRTVDQILRELS